VELVEREIVEMTPVGWLHVESVSALTGVLADLRGTGRFLVSVQNPLVLGDHGEHYPDLVLYREGVRGRVPEAWLMELRAGVVEVHSGPHAGGYGAVRTYARGEVMRSATFAEVVAFGAEEVLPG
jgi:hypothetical protein